MFDVYRLTKQKTLYFRAPFFFENLELFIDFNALGNQRCIYPIPQRNNSANKQPCLEVILDVS